MSTPREILLGPLSEAARLLPTVPFTPNACIQLLATGLQESKLVYRRQMNNGPAAGLLQFEAGGGVKGVLNHPASKGLAIKLCNARKVAPSTVAVWNALQTDDVLAMGFGRLLYWTDSRRIPERDDVEGSWQMYKTIWRPGRPHREFWDANHATAVSAVINADDK